MTDALLVTPAPVALARYLPEPYCARLDLPPGAPGALSRAEQTDLSKGLPLAPFSIPEVVGWYYVVEADLAKVDSREEPLR